MPVTASICERVTSISVEVSYMHNAVCPSEVLEATSVRIPSRGNRASVEEVVHTSGLIKDGNNKRMFPWDESSEESYKEMDYRKETASGIPLRRSRSPLSTMNQIWCNRCGTKILDSRATAGCRFSQVCLPDSNHGTRYGAFAKFKRSRDYFLDESRSELLSLSEEDLDNHGSKPPCVRLPWKVCGEASIVCTCSSQNSTAQAKNCHRLSEGTRKCINWRSASTRLRSYSPAVGQRSALELDPVTKRQHRDRCGQFSKRFSLFRKVSESRPREYLQTTKRNAENKSPSKLDLSNVKAIRLRTLRGTTKTLLFINLSWIFTSVGFFLNCCRALSCAATYRKSNGFTRNCITFALWTLVILPGDSKRVLGNSLLVTPGQFCTRSRNLNARQQEICQNHSSILKYIEEGVQLASHRCQNEFQYNRWNCSSSPKSFYSKLLNQDVRETAYVTAVTSAAVTYAVTYACSKGEIPDCGCREKSVNSYNLLKAEARKRNIQVNESQLRRAAAAFEWGGCSDIVDYGERISEIFTGNFGRKYQSKDLKGRIEEHNMESGRLAITNYMRKECRCHGVTGSCTLTTCWDKMPKWQEVGSHIRTQFDKAVRVQLANDGNELLPTRKQRPPTKEYPHPRQPYPGVSLSGRIKRAPPDVDPPGSARSSAGGSMVAAERRRRRRKRMKSMKKKRGGDRLTTVEDEHLVYSQESPNFCRRVRKHGTLGTSGRRCIPNVTGAGSCEYLCCGRPYTQRQVTITSRCNCRLEYCCKVICDECTTQETIYTCD